MPAAWAATLRASPDRPWAFPRRAEGTDEQRLKEVNTLPLDARPARGPPTDGCKRNA
jgi:hypothetical protein